MKERKEGEGGNIAIVMKWKKHNWVEMRWNAFGDIGWSTMGYDVSNIWR